MTKTFEGVVQYDAEDSGLALISTIYDERVGPDGFAFGNMFVRIQSYDETCEHEEAKQYAGKRVRVTIELLEM